MMPQTLLSTRPQGLQELGDRSDRMNVLRTVLFIALGGGVGFGVHRYIGCRTGACHIWASPYASTIYGALLGFLLSN